MMEMDVGKNGGQRRSRTADLRVMNPSLSPTELPGRGDEDKFNEKIIYVVP